MTDDGMTTDVRFLQFEKALVPIVVRFDVIFNVCRLLHSLNALAPIEPTDGIITDCNDEHPENANVPIDGTDDENVIVERLLQL